MTRNPARREFVKSRWLQTSRITQIILNSIDNRSNSNGRIFNNLKWLLWPIPHQSHLINRSNWITFLKRNTWLNTSNSSTLLSRCCSSTLLLPPQIGPPTPRTHGRQETLPSTKPSRTAWEPPTVTLADDLVSLNLVSNRPFISGR